MRPYHNIRLTEYPDITDIQEDGRASHVGRVKNGSGDYKPYVRTSRIRKAIRRLLKRINGQRENRFQEDAER